MKPLPSLSDLDPDDAHLREHMVQGERVFQGRLLDVRRDTIRLPDGGAATREYIAHNGAVMVVPLLDDGRLLMERQYRYPLGRAMIEFPAGKLELGEAGFVCGARELQEETGHSAREWAYAGELHNAIAYSSERIEVWFARGLSGGDTSLDEGEFLDVFAASLDELSQWAREGRITDAKTLVGLLWLQQLQAGAWTLDWRSAEQQAAAHAADPSAAATATAPAAPAR
jgi:ADP-ribose pyrophosphatase